MAFQNSRKKEGENISIFELRRQAVHAFGIVTILPLLLFGKLVGLAFSFGILTLFVAWALLRQGGHWPFKGINKFVESFVRNDECSGERPMLGAIMFYLGATLAILFFSDVIAAASIVVLALGDSVSTVIGVYFGKHKIPVNKKKSVEGSAAFFLVSLIALLFFVNPLKAFLAAFVAMVVEALPRIDDNVSIPLAVGIVLTFLAYFNI